MNYNILSYGLYLPITFYITILVGRELHKAGKYFVCEMIRHDKAFANAVNNSLLIGYYLINLGYVTIMISSWQEITCFTSLLITLCDKIGIILITLGFIHFMNMLVLTLSATDSTKTKLMFHSK